MLSLPLTASPFFGLSFTRASLSPLRPSRFCSSFPEVRWPALTRPLARAVSRLDACKSPFAPTPRCSSVHTRRLFRKFPLIRWANRPDGRATFRSVAPAKPSGAVIFETMRKPSCLRKLPYLQNPVAPPTMRISRGSDFDPPTFTLSASGPGMHPGAFAVFRCATGRLLGLRFTSASRDTLLPAVIFRHPSAARVCRRVRPTLAGEW